MGSYIFKIYIIILFVTYANCQIMDVFNFLSTLFGDATNAAAFLQHASMPPAGRYRIWIQGAESVAGSYPTIRLYDQNKNLLGSTADCNNGNNIDISRGKYAFCDIAVSTDPYWIQITPNANGNTAISSLVGTYDTNGGDKGNLFNILLTGDNLYKCFNNEVPPPDNNLIQFGSAIYKNIHGFWLVDPYFDSKDDTINPSQIAFSLPGFQQYAKNDWSNCGMMSALYGTSCTKNNPWGCMKMQYPGY
jgi:hypothetical protein